jgi:hypothetical protein
MYVFSANLTLIVALDLEHSPQIVRTHVMVDLQSEKETLSDQLHSLQTTRHHCHLLANRFPSCEAVRL